MSLPKSVCVFCGARNFVNKEYIDIAGRFGAQLAQNNVELVYGGGDCGLMGAVANGSLKAGGKVIGVFPDDLKNLEVEHKGLSEIYFVRSMHERKKKMFDLSEAFVILPGGFGTMDETFEIITWKQLRMHAKPIVMYNHNGYWNPWVQLTENIIGQGFASEEARGLYTVVDNFGDLLDATRQLEP